MQDLMKVKGRVRAVLRDEHGLIKHDETVDNIITTNGRKMLVQRAFSTSSPQAAATGMKLGTDSATAATVTGAGAALVGYISGSNKTFDATPTEATQGNGSRLTMVCSWAAGVATNADIEEVVVVNDAATNATTTEANTYGRAIITTVNKGASDTLQVTWTWDIGA